MAKAKVTYEINAKDKSGKAVNAAQKRLENFAKQGPKLVAAAAVGATAGLAALTKSAAASADQIGKLTLQLGVSERGLSQLKFIAAQTGVEFNTFTMAMQRSTRRVSEAAIGTGEAKDALRELGLNAQSLNQLAPEDQFAAMAKALSSVSNQADQVRLAFKLFDSEGVRLLRTINATGGEFDALNQRASQLGVVIDSNLTAKAEAVNNSWDETSQALAGVGNSLLSTFAPAIVAAANSVTGLIVKALDLAEAMGFVEAQANAEGLRIVTEQIAEAEERLAFARERSSERVRGQTAAAQQVNELTEELNALLERRAEIEATITESKQAQELSENNIGEALAANTEVIIAANAAQFEALQESLLTEEEAILSSYNKRTQIILANTANDGKMREQLLKKEGLRVEKTWLQHQAKMGNIEAKGILKRRKFEEMNTKQKSAFVLGELSSLTSGVAQTNKTMFKINKIASIGEAVVSGAKGVARTLAEYPYPFNIPMAAAHGVAALAQINSIKNTSFGGGGGSITAPSGGAAAVPSIPTQDVIPETFETAPIADEPLTAGPGEAVTTGNVIQIDFSGGITSVEAVRDFIENDLSEAIRDGVGLDVEVVNV